MAIAADCKSAPSGFGGSSPPPPTKKSASSFASRFFFQAEVAQLVEQQPSKLRVASSNLVFRSEKGNLKSRCSSGVERILGKDEVMSSIPITGSFLCF